jgi:hypothetical protein
MGLMEAGVSYGSVLRGVPVVSDPYIEKQVKHARRPITEHPSYRLARLIAADSTSAQSLLDQAETLADQHDVHPSTAIVLAAAVLERHVRELAQRRKVEVRDNAALATYGQRLYDGNAVRLHHKRQLDMLSGIRNDAAHGWFDKVNRDQARDFVADARRIIAAYPL